MKKQLLNKFVVKSCQKTILIETSDFALRDYFSNDPLPKVHIPCLDIIFNKKKLKHDFTIQHSINKIFHNTFINQESENHIKLKTSANVPPGQFVFALLPIFEKLYEMDNSFGLHAACLSLNDWIIFVIGDTKCGKSTIASKLHFDYKAKYISDEKVVLNINKNKIVGGTSVMSLRKETITNKNIIANISQQKLNNSQSTSKLYYIPKEKTIYPIEIKKILYVFPHLSNLKFPIEKLNDFILNYLLYENITCNIRSALSLFVEDSLPLPCQDNQLMAIKRALTIKKFLKDIKHKAIDITGDLTYTINQILKEIN